jgi:hypothetical protein
MRTVPPTEKGKYRAIASGAIANGKPVVVNSAGTVSVVSGQTASAATAVVFETADAKTPSITFDSSNNRIVIAFRDQDNSGYGTSIVGTVGSDGSISFGTAVVFESANTENSAITFDSSNNKVVITYVDNGNSGYGTAIVGTVDSSDNSISFGSAATYQTSSSAGTDAIVFDSSNNKVVVASRDIGDSGKGKAYVGTVSGTNISFGSAVEFNAGSTNYINAAFDSTNNKVIIAYADSGNSEYGTAIVGTVSGTSISFGSEVVFESADSRWISLAHDTSNQKTVIAYHDAGNSDYVTAIVGTVSGTSISFGTAVVVQSTSNYGTDTTFNSNDNLIVISYRDYAGTDLRIIDGTVSGTSISFGSSTIILDGGGYTPVDSTAASNHAVENIFDSNANKTISVFRNMRNSNYGTAIAYTSAVPTNLTTENYIGIANSCSFHGNTETITVTVAGGIFYLDGVANPVIQLLKGHTYIFDQADGTNSGHPLHFKDSGGSQYTTGVTVTGTAGSAGAKVTIAIASDATEPTRYYCTVHGNGMGNTINLSDSFVNVDVIGTVNDQQSSLTAGQQYFVQTDGTLGETADSPSVFAGTAISATELVVKE